MPDPEKRPVSNLKIPLLWGFYYLKNEFTFETALKDIIRKKGDTDNNAAIVGALLGAAYGIEGIPSELIDRVMRLETIRGLYSPKQSLKQMVTIAIDTPKDLEVLWDSKILKGKDVVEQCIKEAEGI